MSNKPERRGSPLRAPTGDRLDPEVVATLQRTARLASGGTLQKVTVRLPADLVEVLKREATTLTGHKRRGFSDLLALCARHGLEAYLRGEMEVEVQPAVVECRIVAAR